MHRLVAAALFAPVLILSAQEFADYRPVHPYSDVRERTVDFEHMDLEVHLYPEAGRVRGTVEYRLRPLRTPTATIRLDAPGIRIEAVKVDDEPARYVTDAEGLTVHLDPPLFPGTSHRLRIRYEAHPRKGLYFIGWNDTTGRRRRLVWTQGQGIDNRHWFPAYDSPNDKLTTDIKIYYPSGFEVLSNGRLVRRKRLGDTTLWHYRMDHPHATYLVMMGAGPYRIRRRQAGDVELRLYYYADFPESAEPTYRYSAAHLRHLEQRLGVPYPWGRTYSQIPVEDFLYGAMENTTATVFTDYYLVDARGALDHPYWEVDAHELVHQWFGDYVTILSDHHMWLHESFATYYARWLMGMARGKEAELESRYRAQQNAIRADRRNTYPIIHPKGGSARIYSKGSCVLDMLQYLVGREDYDRVITHYLQKHAWSNVTTDDLQRAFADVLGRNVDTFFREWLYKGGHPQYRVRKRLYRQGDTPVIVLEVTQTQAITPLTTYFSLPVEVEIHLDNDSVFRRRLPMRPQALNVFHLPLPPGTTPRLVLFDPDEVILKELDFDKPAHEWYYQARHAQSILKRRAAVEQLVRRKPPTLTEWLDTLYFTEPSPFVLEAVLAGRARQSDAGVHRIFAHALSHPSARVRKAALRHLPEAAPFTAHLKRLLNDSSYAVVRSALQILLRQFPERRWEWLGAARHQVGLQKEIRTLWLQYACLDSADRYLPELKDYATPSYEFRTRLNAFRALQALNHLDADVARSLWEAAFHFNRRFRNPVRQIIRNYARQPKYRALLLDAARELPADQRSAAMRLIDS